MYSNIGIAIAFSPRCEAILNEAAYFQQTFNANLSLIHVGNKTDKDEQFLINLIESSGIDKAKVEMIWENGDPSKMITKVCKKKNIDLLVAGALQQENIVKYYVGSIARNIMRKSDCSILSLVEPLAGRASYDKIVIDGTGGVKNIKTIQRGLRLATQFGARQVHVFKAIPAYGLSMVAAEEETEIEYSETKRNIVQQEIQEMSGIVNGLEKGNYKINIKVAAGKPAFQIRKFAEVTKANLMIMRAPDRQMNVLDRFFPSYIEQVINFIPTNLLIDRASK